MLQDLLPFLIWTLELTWLALFLAGLWRTFQRAGSPGWKALIPIYNAFELARLAGKPPVWGLLLLVPGLNLFVVAPVSIRLAGRLGRGTPFGLGLAYLPLVFYPWAGLAPDAREVRA